MPNLDVLLARHPNARSDAYRPIVFAPDDPELTALLEREPGLVVRDTYLQQLAALAEARDPTLADDAIEPAARALLGGRPPARCGSWVYLPWRGELVHLLERDAFRQLRANRNHLKITPDEQHTLRSKRVGVIGLSVGQSAAITLAMEGVGGHLRLADPDCLELSNLNRLRCGVSDLGERKAVLAARAIAEIDPYLPVDVFTDGVHPGNLEAFVLDNGKLDLIVEECDDLWLKVRLRELAARHGVPVMMCTDDRGMIDVERFDHDSTRPPFHGLAGHLEADAMVGLSTKDKVPYVLKILGEDKVSARMAASLVEIEETLVSYPQLASEATLAGAMAADAARRILLGTFMRSGRFYVDLPELVCDETADVVPLVPPAPDGVSEEARAPSALPGLRSAGRISTDQVRDLVRLGTMAPSGGNVQPWRFVWDGDGLTCLHDLERSESFLDFRHEGTYLAFGACIENLVLGARALGVEPDIALFPDAADPLVVARLRFDGGRPVGPRDRYEHIAVRVTNRRLGERVPLTEAQRAGLLRAASGARLQLLTTDDELDAIGEILGAGDKVRFLHPVMHEELIRELRWNREEVERTRDGVDLATLELSPSDAAGMRILAMRNAMRFLSGLYQGVGRALGKSSREAISAASTVGLLTVDSLAPNELVRGGRVLQRIWLDAGPLGLAFQPMTALAYVFARLERGDPGAFDPKEAALLRKLRGRYRELFDVPEGHGELMLFRLSVCGPPTARALRRHVEDVFEIRT